MPNPKGKHLMNGSETNKGQGLDKNKQNINKNGRPRKGVSYLSAEIKKKIGETPTKTQIEDIIIAMLELTTDELEEIKNDKDSSIMIKTIAERLIANDKSFDALNSLLDRGIGKAVQREEKREVDGDGNDIFKDVKITIEKNGTQNNDGILE